MSRVLIRIAVVSDAGSIAQVLAEAFAEYRSLYTQAAFNATCPTSDVVLRRMTEGPVWVAELAGLVAGTVAAVSKGDGLYIRGMAILPAARGQATGRLLLETVEQYALEHGHQRMMLSTTPFLGRAIRLYESAGFRRTEVGIHDLFGTSLFTMEKRLRPDARDR